MNLDKNRRKQRHQELYTSDDEGSGGGSGNIVRNAIIGRKNSASSTNSSESRQASLLSTSSANLETQLEDGPEEQEQQKILGSEKIRTSETSEILRSGRSCTEHEYVEKTENEEMPCTDMVKGIVFVPKSDPECSSDPVVHGLEVLSNARAKQRFQNVEGLKANILDSLNDADSNGSFELIDEGRIGDVDSLPDQYDIGSIKQQLSVQSVYEVEHIRKETMMDAEEKRANGSKCVSTVQVQDDVHDLQVCACKRKIIIAKNV